MTSHTSPKPCPRCGVLRQARPTGWCRDCRDVRHAENEWMARGACQGHLQPELWWPETSDPALAQHALALCATCEVVDDCLEYAVNGNEVYGIWGGTTPHQRQAMRAYLRKKVV